MAYTIRPYSLSWHLVALVLAAMLPFLLFAALLVNWLVNLERAHRERALQHTAEALIDLIDYEFKTTIRTLQALAASSALPQGDLRAFHEELTRVLKTQPSWKTIQVHTPDGQVLLNAVRKFGEQLGPVAEPVSIATVAKTGLPAVGKVVKVPPGNQFAGMIAFPIRVPVIEKGRTMYVLSALISVASLQNLAESASSPETWVRTVIDSQGTVAARTRSPEIFVGQDSTPSFRKTMQQSMSGIVRETTLEGKAVFLAFLKSPYSGWTAAVGVPEGALEAPANQSIRLILTVGLCLLLIFGGTALLYSRRLSKQIASATSGAAVLAQGQVPKIARSMVQEVELLNKSLLSAAQLLQLRDKEREQLLQDTNAARVEAERANRAKSEFLANMSHELRTPLGVVLGFAELLASGDDTPEERAETLSIIQRNGQHLLRLIDDILDLAKVEAQKLTVERVDFSLHELITSLVSDLKPQATEKGIHLNVALHEGVPDIISCDPLRLRQIIYNIVGNAIKFTAAGAVDLDLRSVSNQLIITVRDSGIGLSPEQQKVLFKTFTQADSSHTRKFGGSGLGLALSRRLAELLGGGLELIESHPGQGSVFQIRVSLKA